MTANISTPTVARRVAKWVSPEVATALRCGHFAELYIAVPRATGKIDDATYFVEAILDQVSGQVTAWKMTRKNNDGSWGEEYIVTFGAFAGCGCKSAKYGKGTECKHNAGLRAALNHIGINVAA